MTFELFKSTQFLVKEIIIVTKKGLIDITNLYEEINLYDSIFMPVSSGNILIKDAVSLARGLMFDGSDVLLLEIHKSENSEVIKYKKSFRIYSQSNRRNSGLNSEIYSLNFVSDEMIYSDQQRVNQSYDGFLYSEIADKILLDYLNVSEKDKKGTFDKTIGIKKLVIPNLRPLEAIEWCAKRSVDEKKSPNFLFFQNRLGFNYASLSNLLTRPEILEVKFHPKNMESNSPLDEMQSVRALEIITDYNEIEKIRLGVNAGKFIGFDLITRVIKSKDIAYKDHFESLKHGNENYNITDIINRGKKKNVEMFDSKKVLSNFGEYRKYSEYIKSHDPTSIQKEDDIEDFAFHRIAILKNLMSRRLKIVLPGNFDLSSGFNVKLIAPYFSSKERDQSDEDPIMSGKYLIVAARHVIGFDKHETLLEIATSSSGYKIPSSGDLPTNKLMEY